MRSRSAAVTVAAVLLGILSALNLVSIFVPAFSEGVPAIVVYGGAVLGILGLVAAYGLWALKRWSVWLTIILSAVSILLSVPPILFGPTVAIQVLNILSGVAFALIIVLVLLPASRRVYTVG